MARVFIDAHMFSVAWFRSVLDELVSCPNVTFAYPSGIKISDEISRVRQALSFYKLMGAREKRDDIPAECCGKHINYLSEHSAWKKCPDCDDPHVFALVFIKPTPYVFSLDKRMAACRREMNKYIDSRYCKFIIISREELYQTHRKSVVS